MKTIRSFLIIGIMLTVAMATMLASAPVEAAKSAEAAEAYEPPNKAIFTRPLIWRADSSANYSFKGAALTNAELAKDGSVKSYNVSQGTCELPNPYKTNGLVTGLSASWSFTGKVILEVSITGSAKDYVEVINGVPVTYKESAYGSRIKWRATLAPNSTLTELKITYSDLSGVVGSFGESLLSGFGMRKQIYIKGSKAGTLFNYQMPIKVGESEKSPLPYDVKLFGGILSGFADIRFTLPDGETVLPHYVESVTGKAPNRTAVFWVKIPEIPEGGLPIYMYYSKAGAADLSDGEKVFDFFDSFEGTALNEKKWKIELYDKEGRADVGDSLLSLDKARVTSANYKFASGLIEYKARASVSGAAVGIIRSAISGDDDVIAYSSASSSALGHSIAEGSAARANDPKPVSPNMFYTYKIYCDDNGGIAFRRYGADGSGTAQAETEYLAGASDALPIGLSSPTTGGPMYCDWIRTRKAANPPPQVDPKTASVPPEATNLPEFYNVSTAPDGSLVPAHGSHEGHYVSRIVNPAFEVRIMRLSWEADSSDDNAISASVSVKKGGKFYPKWKNGVTHYVSKKEFDKGSQLRWKVEFKGLDATDDWKLKKFNLEYGSGVIRVVMPKGGEVLVAGAKYGIFWDAPGYDPKYPVDISYSKSAQGEFTTIVRKTNNSGDYDWIVPADLSGKMLVKVADYYDKSIYGMSEDYFLVVPEASAGDLAPVTDKQASVGVEEGAPEEGETQSQAKVGLDDAGKNYVLDKNITISTDADIAFKKLTLGDGTGKNITRLILNNNIDPASGSIVIRKGGELVQGNNKPQVISGDLIIENGGILTHKANSASKSYIIDFAADNIVLKAAGIIDASGKGYGRGDVRKDAFGKAAGRYMSKMAGGGKHTYDTERKPKELGSGGAGSWFAKGGAGGGAITLVAKNEFSISGTIDADGEAGSISPGNLYDAGGGAGGSIYLEAQKFTGSGAKITATGGSGNKTGGAGAGGRIHIKAPSGKISGTMNVNGGGGQDRAPGSLIIE